MSPKRTVEHQRVVGHLAIEMLNFVKQHDLGKVFMGPCDINIDNKSNSLQPDISFISKSNNLVKEESGFWGSPDLIIEALSPFNHSHDNIIKKEIYERFGVKEFWIIDPDTKESTGFLLKDNKFEIIGQFKSIIKCVILNREFGFRDSSL